MHGEHIIATSTVSIWEEMLNCKFYSWQGKVGTESIVRAPSFSLPEEIKEYVFAVFNVDDLPHPQTFKKMSATEVETRSKLPGASPNRELGSAEQYTAISAVAEQYRIPLRRVNVTDVTQAVFTPSDYHFSQEDLHLFQDRNNLFKMAAEDPFNLSIPASNCAIAACQEGNFDLQYIMGIAQGVPTTFQSALPFQGDALVGWSIYAANLTDPPPGVLSISFAINENVKCLSLSSSSRLALPSSSYPCYK
jgi:hypothetical protein